MRTPRARVSLLDVSLLGRHQIAAALGTTADFTAMIALVELAGLAPPTATIASATLGAIVNFALSRGWAFRTRHDGTLASQASRYALVSAGGAVLNAGLLALALEVTRGYAALRVGVAILVSVVYTYPLHTRVVFRVRA